MSEMNRVEDRSVTVMRPDSVSPTLRIPSSDPMTKSAPSGDTSKHEICIENQEHGKLACPRFTHAQKGRSFDIILGLYDR